MANGGSEVASVAVASASGAHGCSAVATPALSWQSRTSSRTSSPLTRSSSRRTPPPSSAARRATRLVAADGVAGEQRAAGEARDRRRAIVEVEGDVADGRSGTHAQRARRRAGAGERGPKLGELPEDRVGRELPGRPAEGLHLPAGPHRRQPRLLARAVDQGGGGANLSEHRSRGRPPDPAPVASGRGRNEALDLEPGASCAGGGQRVGITRSLLRRLTRRRVERPVALSHPVAAAGGGAGQGEPEGRDRERPAVGGRASAFEGEAVVAAAGGRRLRLRGGGRRRRGRRGGRRGGGGRDRRGRLDRGLGRGRALLRRRLLGRRLRQRGLSRRGRSRARSRAAAKAAARSRARSRAAARASARSAAATTASMFSPLIACWVKPAAPSVGEAPRSRRTARSAPHGDRARARRHADRQRPRVGKPRGAMLGRRE